MKKLLLGIALFTIGCSSQSLTGPSTARTASGETAAASGASTPESESAQGANGGSEATTPSASSSPTLQYTLDGAHGCLTAGSEPMRWNLLVSDAGPSTIRFVALSHQSPDPGCAATVDSPRDRVRMTGALNYAPHTAGQTQFMFDPELYSCGRVQVDVSAFDATGKETLLIGMVVNYGTTCAPPPPPPPPPPAEALLECASQPQRVTVNQMVHLAATGGTGAFTWQAPTGSPAGGSGPSFATSYAEAGTHTVTVSSGNQRATCTLVVETVPPPPLVCSPSNQSVLTGAPVVLTVAGGTGTYAWSATGGTPSAGQGASFATSFSQAGTHTVTVSSGTATTSCPVAVTTPPPPPTCEELNPASFVTVFPVAVAGRLVPIIGTAQVRNQGTWELSLYATSSIDEYTSSQPDYVKAIASQTLACDQSTTLQVDYPWMTHPAKYWWVELTRNGVRVFKSAAEVNPAVVE